MMNCFSSLALENRSKESLFKQKNLKLNEISEKTYF